MWNTMELPRTYRLPFLDTLTKSTPNSIESTVYRKPTYTDRHLNYNSNHPISATLSVIYILINRAKKVCSTPEFLAKEMDRHTNPTRKPLPNTVLSTRQTPTENQQKAKPIHRKVLEGVELSYCTSKTPMNSSHPIKIQSFL